MAMNTEYLSADTTNFSHLSLSGTLKLGALETRSTLSSGAITGTTGVFKSTLSVVGQATLGPVSFTTAAGSTITQFTDVTAGRLFITVGASGLSVGIRSANSLYWINSTVSSA